MARTVRVLGAIIGILLVIGVMSGCEGEPPGDDNAFPQVRDRYTESDFETIRYRCTVTWETASGEAKEYELSKSDSVELYNLLDRGAWTTPETDPTAATRPILTLEFTAGDPAKPKNCFGCVYLSDSDDVVYTPSAVLGGLTPYVAPKGTYDAVWAKIAAVTGET